MADGVYPGIPDSFYAPAGSPLYGGLYSFNQPGSLAATLFGAGTLTYWGTGSPTGGTALSPASTATSTGVNPTETSYSLYGHTIPLSVFGIGRIGGEIIAGPWISGGLASFCISFGVPADPSGTRELREIAFDSEVVWNTTGFFTEPFTYRFYGGTLTQSADALEISHFGANAVAYRPQILVWFENLPLAGTKFGKIPYVSCVIADTSGDDVNLGEAFERLAYSPFCGLTSDQFETSGITDGLVGGGLIIASSSEFLPLIQQFGRFYNNWDILQTDKLRIVDRGSNVTADISLDTTRLKGKIAVSRRGSDAVKKDLELSTIDPEADYTIVPSVSQRPRYPVAVTTSVGKETAFLPVIMDSSTRIAIATFAKYHEEATRKTISGTAMAYGLQMEPGDLVAIQDLGDDFTDEIFKVVETTHGADNTVEFTATSIFSCNIEVPEIFDAFNISLISNDFGWDNTNIRQHISSVALAQSGTSTRLTLFAGYSDGCAIDSMYIGNPALVGDPYDFDGGQVQVTVGGLSTFSISAFGSVVTDEIPFAVDATKDLIISCHFTTPGTILVRGGQANVTAYAKSGASEASVSNVTGYSTFNLLLALVSRIEVFV